MSKTYLPIHSDQPEERFVVEKLEPKQFGRSDHWNTESEAEHNEAYEAHLKYQGSAAKYPFPALTREMPDKLVEGVDFKLGMQRFIDGLDKWVDCGKIEYDSISWQLHQSHRRIIAVPISVKTEPTPSVESMEDVLKNVQETVGDYGGEEQYSSNQAMAAMRHWASIKCAEKDREIDELKRDKLYWQLEASAKNKELATKEEAVKELVELLDRIVGSMVLERAERFDLNNSAKYLITKHKTP